MHHINAANATIKVLSGNTYLEWVGSKGKNWSCQNDHDHNTREYSTVRLGGSSYRRLLLSLLLSKHRIVDYSGSPLMYSYFFLLVCLHFFTTMNVCIYFCFCILFLYLQSIPYHLIICLLYMYITNISLKFFVLFFHNNKPYFTQQLWAKYFLRNQ